MKTRLFPWLLLTLLCGCASLRQVAPDPSRLRVGVTADFPPLIFKQGGQFSGVEADFARALSAEMKRELVFIERPWSRLLDDLEQNRIDVVMSGMTVTNARQFRVNFATPYMVAGQTGLFRRDGVAPGGLLQTLMRHQNGRIGTVKNTSGAFFAMQAYPNATHTTYASFGAGVRALKQGRINMLVFDAPQVWWTAAREEASLQSFPELLNNESLAWAISKNNTALLEEVNAIMGKWKEDGTGERIFQNWFPAR